MLLTITPEDMDRLGAERVAAEARLGTTLDSTFAENAAYVTRQEDGSEALTLHTPWVPGGRRGAEIATMQVTRNTTEAGGAQTDILFTSKHAWNNRVRIVQDPDNGTTMHSVEIVDGKQVVKPVSPSDFMRANSAKIWANNLQNSSPERPGAGRRTALKLLGSRAIKNT
jgi:hypothetical protein